ncbi:MarR family winged helix-turn-helix transcriptional regulator [Enterovibrio baiacu]|uniref:MarR family winged helix-turn-helix transcriptional regulator n=1 Tax=Enterovibrio baiacu TaxID=2491023 RepID=UPI003D1033F2
MNDIEPICDILERITTLYRNEVRLVGVEHGLHPVHLEVIYYLARCNKYSDTPAAVTEFLGITKGTTSQSISLLEAKGYLTKEKDPVDRRVSHLVLTPHGEAMAKKAIPPASFKQGLERLGGGNAQLKTQLETLLRDIQRSTQSASFGLCKTCKFHTPVSDAHFYCALTKETLVTDFGTLICREHSEVQ